MNGADIPRAENIREIGRHGSKSAAVHRGDDAKCGGENHDRLDARESGRDGVTNHAEREEDKIGCLAADRIGKRCPKNLPPMLNNEKSPTNPPPIAAAKVFWASENFVEPVAGSLIRGAPE